LSQSLQSKKQLPLDLSDVHRPEPHIMLFRRPLNLSAAAGHAGQMMILAS